MQNLTHLRTCLDEWMGAIASSHQQEETTLELPSSGRTREKALTTLILAYSVGCLQNIEHQAATALQKTSDLDALLLNFIDKNHQAFQDIDAMMHTIVYDSITHSQLIRQDAIFISHCSTLVQKALSAEKAEHRARTQQQPRQHPDTRPPRGTVEPAVSQPGTMGPHPPVVLPADPSVLAMVNKATAAPAAAAEIAKHDQQTLPLQDLLVLTGWPSVETRFGPLVSDNEQMTVMKRKSQEMSYWMTLSLTISSTMTQQNKPS